MKTKVYLGTPYRKITKLNLIGSDYSGFKYNHYSRFQTDYFNVSFANAEYKYTIFSNYEDERESCGVSVTNLNSKKESVYGVIRRKRRNFRYSEFVDFCSMFGWF